MGVTLLGTFVSLTVGETVACCVTVGITIVGDLVIDRSILDCVCS
jgi:hypothetical protein